MQPRGTGPQPRGALLDQLLATARAAPRQQLVVTTARPRGGRLWDMVGAPQSYVGQDHAPGRPKSASGAARTRGGGWTDRQDKQARILSATKELAHPPWHKSLRVPSRVLVLSGLQIKREFNPNDCRSIAVQRLRVKLLNLFGSEYHPPPQRRVQI